MSPREWLAQLLTRRGGQFLDLVVNGALISNVQPLGNFLTPGVTKVGRLSFVGWLDGKKVKIYSTHSDRQAKLRVHLDSYSFSSFSFPSVLAYDKCMIVEEWVDGVSVKPGVNCEESATSGIIKEMHHFTSQLDRAWMDKSPFCYFEDYLLARLERWQGVRQVSEFLSSWRQEFSSIETLISPRLCHPDLNPRNMIKCSTSGKIFVIDNELLGIGPGWILDWHNAGVPDHALTGFTHSSEIERFLSLSWDLRRLGSMLDASDYGAVRRFFGF